MTNWKIFIVMEGDLDSFMKKTFLPSFFSGPTQTGLYIFVQSQKIASSLASDLGSRGIGFSV